MGDGIDEKYLYSTILPYGTRRIAVGIKNLSNSTRRAGDNLRFVDILRLFLKENLHAVEGDDFCFNLIPNR